jgi:hypothetical protein
MKATINSKIYNTATAELLAEWDNLCFTGDFNYCSEDLYKTQKGAFFIYGCGGALSSYAQSCGSNERGGGSAIRPLTAQEALAWCEEKECQDAIDNHFADLVEEA